MKNIWKWILGILAVVLVLGAVSFAAYLWTSHSGFMMARGWHDSPMMMGRGGFSPFFGPFAVLGGLVKLAFFGALLYGAYWLGKRNARVVLDSPPAVPAEPAPQADKPA